MESIVVINMDRDDSCAVKIQLARLLTACWQGMNPRESMSMSESLFDESGAKTCPCLLYLPR